MDLAAHGASLPSLRSWRRRFRQARRGHHDRSWGDALSDLYTLLWFVLIYGTALYTEARRALGTPAATDGAAERIWLGLAGLIAGAGLAWAGLRAVGPLLATDAERSWIVSTPLDRRGWLTPRFLGLLAAGGALGGTAGFALAVAGSGDLTTLPPLLAGSMLGLALTAIAVVAQGPDRARWAGALGPTLLAGGAGLAAVVIGRSFAGRSLRAPHLHEPLTALIVGALVLGAFATIASAWKVLARLDARALGSGAPVAAAAVTSAILLDPRLLGSVLEARHWRRVGRVPSRAPGRPFAGLPGRLSALLRAETIRLSRRPGALFTAAGLLLVQYALAVTAPSMAGISRIVLAYLVAGRLMAGLRAIARSPGLRRSLGGSDLKLRLVHLVLPSLGVAIWWLTTVPTTSLPPGISLLLLLGVMGAAYRAATRGPLNYSGAVIETPFGLFPVDLLVSLARGPDLLGATILVGVLLG